MFASMIHLMNGEGERAECSPYHFLFSPGQSTQGKNREGGGGQIKKGD